MSQQNNQRTSLPSHYGARASLESPLSNVDHRSQHTSGWETMATDIRTLIGTFTGYLRPGFPLTLEAWISKWILKSHRNSWLSRSKFTWQMQPCPPGVPWHPTLDVTLMVCDCISQTILKLMLKESLTNLSAQVRREYNQENRERVQTWSFKANQRTFWHQWL